MSVSTDTVQCDMTGKPKGVLQPEGWLRGTVAVFVFTAELDKSCDHHFNCNISKHVELKQIEPCGGGTWGAGPGGGGGFTAATLENVFIGYDMNKKKKKNCVLTNCSET